MSAILIKSINLYLVTSICLLGVVLGARTTVHASGGAYKLGAGDLIKIQVFREDDMDREVRIGTNGYITYPLVGELEAVGLTARGLEKLVAKRLTGRFFKAPVVTVAILEFRPFYVNGEVEKPGSYPYQPGLTVRKAISVAGGLKERASRRKIHVIREKDSSATPEPTTMDAPIGPGDIVYVDQSFF
ncbi:MAG TPA: polysaccharide export protein [Acidiferrobacteraceae bacterium]|nr:polysaccharide export protein [Acidiferrobacteraceae bacterium]